MTTNQYKELNGLTLAFPARSSLVLSLISLDLPTAASAEIEDTDLSSTVKKSFASAVVDQGEVAFMSRYAPGLAIPVAQPDETIVITFPMLPGQTVAGTLTFTGHITKQGGEKAANGTRAERSISIKVNSVPVWVEGT